MLEEVRITGLGVIDDAVLELSAGFNVVTGETGAGKTMVVSGLGLLFGGRADPARVRPGAERASVEGRLRRRRRRPGGPAGERGGRRPGRRRRTLILSRSVSAEGRSRAYAGGRSVPVSLLTYLADDLVAVHGQADQQQLLKPGRQREALDRFAGPELAGAAGQLPAGLPAAPRRARRARRADHRRPASGSGRPRTCAAAWPRSSRRSPPRARTSSCSPRSSGSRTPTRCTRRPRPRTRRCSATRPAASTTRPTRSPCSARRGRRWRRAAQHDAALAALGARVSEAAYLVSDVAADLASYAQSVEADPARLAAVQERRADAGPADPAVRRRGRGAGARPAPREAARRAARPVATASRRGG